MPVSITRNQTTLIKSLVALLLCAFTPARAAQIPSPPKRPNILFIYTDDQRWDALGVVQREQGDRARFPWLQTPNLDKLAAQGLRFRNAFVVNSLCAPSRASFLTGAYGFRNGVVNNHTPFPVENVTYPSLLREAGYKTAYVGKWHMDGQTGKRPGFYYSASFIGQGVYFDCPFEIDGVKTPTTGWVDDVSTSYAIDFMKQAKDSPFALVLGYKTAHGPFTPPPRTANLYEQDNALSTPNFAAPAIYGAGGNRPGAAASRPQQVNTNRGYFRGLTAIDENVGKLLATLDELGIADDTLVIFTSDNGFYLGEHGLGDKRSAYDESLRIPMLVRYPRLGLAGKTLDQMVLNIDVAPTVLDLAGIQPPDSIQGRSWLPLLKGNSTAGRDAFFYCYYFERGFRVPTVTAVRTDSAKLIRYPGHDEWTELFDLDRDPYELKNLYNDPASASLRQQLEAAYEHQKSTIGFQIPPFSDDPAADLPKAGRNAWVLDYQFTADTAAQIKDRSTFGNHGEARHTTPVDGRDGRMALLFEGNGVIELPNSPSLDPNVATWTIEVTVRPDTPSGTILAGGGASRGFSLFLKEGKPVFLVRNTATTAEIASPSPIVGRWSTLKAVIDGEDIALEVDGAKAGAARLRTGLGQTPNDGIAIGQDLGSPVLVPPGPGGFHGLIESVRLGSGKVQ